MMGDIDKQPEGTEKKDKQPSLQQIKERGCSFSLSSPHLFDEAFHDLFRFLQLDIYIFLVNRLAE